jgi:hypothetical protein
MNSRQLAINVAINHNRRRLSIGRIHMPAIGLIEQDPIDRSPSRRRPFCRRSGAGSHELIIASAGCSSSSVTNRLAKASGTSLPRKCCPAANGARHHDERNSQRSACGARAQTAQRFAFNPADIAARRTAGERRTGIASQQSLLIAPLAFQPHSDLSIFQKIGVAGPSSTPLSDFRHALGARYCPSGI